MISICGFSHSPQELCTSIETYNSRAKLWENFIVGEKGSESYWIMHFLTQKHKTLSTLSVYKWINIWFCSLWRREREWAIDKKLRRFRLNFKYVLLNLFNINHRVLVSSLCKENCKKIFKEIFQAMFFYTGCCCVCSIFFNKIIIGSSHWMKISIFPSENVVMRRSNNFFPWMCCNSMPLSVTTTTTIHTLLSQSQGR